MMPSIAAQIGAIFSAPAIPRPRTSRTGPARFYRNSRPAQLAEAMRDGEVWTTTKASKHFGWPHAASCVAMLSLLERGVIAKVGEAKTRGTSMVYLYRRTAA